MKTNYVLIDYENVQPDDLSSLKEHDFKVFVFVGASQPNIPIELAKSLQELGCNAKYVSISGNGKNALDFHIAYYIGQIAVGDDNAFFHIISKDTGYDPLLDHLKEQNVFARRHEKIADIPLLRMANLNTDEDRIGEIIIRLKGQKDSRPCDEVGLANTINHWFRKTLEETQLKKIIKRMVKMRLIKIENEKIIYGKSLLSQN